MVLLRYEAPWLDVPTAASSEVWVQLHGTQVCWIYTILAKLQVRRCARAHVRCAECAR